MEVLPGPYGVTAPSSRRRLDSATHSSMVNDRVRVQDEATFKLEGKEARDGNVVGVVGGGASSNTLRQQQQRGSERQQRRTSSSSKSVKVVVSGSVDGWGSTVSTGITYYTNSMGELISSGSYYGRDAATGGATSASSVGEFYYVYDADSDTIVATDALVGFGSADGELYVLQN